MFSNVLTGEEFNHFDILINELCNKLLHYFDMHDYFLAFHYRDVSQFLINRVMDQNRVTDNYILLLRLYSCKMYVSNFLQSFLRDNIGYELIHLYLMLEMHVFKVLEIPSMFLTRSFPNGKNHFSGLQGKCLHTLIHSWIDNGGE